MLIRIAWRNLWRNRRRTLLTVCSVALGLTLLLVSLGLGDGGHRQMIDSAVRMGSGHVIVQARGYQERAELEMTLSGDEVQRVLEWVREARDRFPIRLALSRVFVSGLASSADGSTGMRLIGVEADKERQVSLFHEKIIRGSDLRAGDPDHVVIGEGISRKLSLQPGSKLVVMAQAFGGKEIEAHLFRVSGILRSGVEDVDESLVLASLPAAQKFLKLGSRVHQVAVFLDDEKQSWPLAQTGKGALKGLEVLDWSEALPELRDYIRIDDGGNYVFQVFIFILVAFTVMNTLQMSVLERQREFALLDALGLNPRSRFLMVVLEAIFVALLSGTLGLLLGYSAHLYLHVHGLPLELFSNSDISAAGVTLDPILYSDLSFERIAGSLLLVVLLTVILGISPALRAARSSDAHLLGHN